MSNYVGQVYKIYKDFFKGFNINYRDVMAMYAEHFGDLNVMTYSNMTGSLASEMKSSSSLDVKAVMNKQEAIREFNAITSCEDIRSSITLHDNTTDAYYIMGIQGEELLVVKPLTNEANKTMKCSTSSCSIQTKTENGVIEEEVKGNRASIRYYSDQDLTEIEEAVSFPSDYQVSQLDPSVVPTKGASLFSFDDKRVFYKYENGQVVSEREYSQPQGNPIYIDFKTYLKQQPAKTLVKTKQDNQR